MNTRRKRLPGTSVLPLLMWAASVPASCAQEPNGGGPTLVQTPQLKAFQAAGREASLSILPVDLAGRPLRQVAEVIGMMLERGGMTHVSLADDDFRPPAGADLDATAKALGDFVKEHPPESGYVLFSEFRVSAKRRFDEVRTIILNAQGDVVWQESLTSADPAFKRVNPKEPMQCCLLVAQRLRPILGLEDPTRGDAPEGRIARRWQEQTGLPDKAERAAIEARAEAFKQAAVTATLGVCPVRAGGAASSEDAARLVSMINEAALAKAVALNDSPRVEQRGSMNEQKVLWGMARSFSESVRAHPPATDYVLYADHLMDKDRVGAVHFVVCDRQGQLVIVDFQNDHHADFKKIDPKSAEDCDRLVLRRLQSYCR